MSTVAVQEAGFVEVQSVPEVLHITLTSINQKVDMPGRKTKYQHNLHLMVIQEKTEQS